MECAITELYNPEDNTCYCAEGMEPTEDNEGCRPAEASSYAAWDTATGKNLIPTPCPEVGKPRHRHRALASLYRGFCNCWMPKQRPDKSVLAFRVPTQIAPGLRAVANPAFGTRHPTHASSAMVAPLWYRALSATDANARAAQSWRSPGPLQYA